MYFKPGNRTVTDRRQVTIIFESAHANYLLGLIRKMGMEVLAAEIYRLVKGEFDA
jgi:hypothetical protein